MIKRTLPLLVMLGIGLVSRAARADEAPIDMAPRAQSAPAAAIAPIDHTRRNVGVSLIVGGSLGVVGGVATSLGMLFGNAFVCDGDPCPHPFSPAEQAAVVAGTVVMGGVVATGIVLLATDKPRPASATARLRPTASGVAFSF